MNLRLFHVEFEANEMVEMQVSYAGPFNWVVQAKDQEHAERLFLKQLKSKGLFLENPDGESHAYTINTIPRRIGVTEM